MFNSTPDTIGTEDEDDIELINTSLEFEWADCSNDYAEDRP